MADIFFNISPPTGNLESRQISKTKSTIGFTLLYFLTSWRKARGVGNSRKIESKTHLFPKQIFRRQNKISGFGTLVGQNSHVPVSSTTFALLESQRNLSRSKINLAFGAGHVIRDPVYFTLVLPLIRSRRLTFSALPANQNSRQQPKMGELKAAKIRSQPYRNQYIYHFMNFSIASYIQTHIPSAGRHILRCYVLFSSQACVHTYIYVSTTWSFYSFCLDGEHRYTQICSSHTFSFV